MELLTPENYAQGMLVDEELMAGITRHPENPGLFVAFVLQHTTGEYLGYQPFALLEDALATLNRIPREWFFEKTGGCAGCGKGDGSCGKVSAGCGAQMGRVMGKAQAQAEGRLDNAAPTDCC